jgi:hypothetical protein
MLRLTDRAPNRRVGRRRGCAGPAADTTGPGTRTTGRDEPADVLTSRGLRYGRSPAARATAPNRPQVSANASTARQLRSRAARHQYAAALTAGEIRSNGMRRWHSRYCPCAITHRARLQARHLSGGQHHRQRRTTASCGLPDPAQTRPQEARCRCPLTVAPVAPVGLPWQSRRAGRVAVHSRAAHAWCPPGMALPTFERAVRFMAAARSGGT